MEDQVLQRKCDGIVYKIYDFSPQDVELVEAETEVTQSATD